jgi:hypothetical protein
MAKGAPRPARERAQEELDKARMNATRLEQQFEEAKTKAKDLHERSTAARRLADHRATHPALQDEDEGPIEGVVIEQPNTQPEGSVQEAVAAVPEPPVAEPKKPTAAEKKAAAKVVKEATGDEATQPGPGPGAALADSDDWFNQP